MDNDTTDWRSPGTNVPGNDERRNGRAGPVAEDDSDENDSVGKREI
ncbi:MAG: hypothetical protein Q4C47_07470 [Planctomycetia bacterium]|nr:hypothetical protein [Planctomycetia bacterium]